jgi:Predicted transcriptional regulators
LINLNYRDSRPIYEQIKDGLRKLLISGAFSQDERLPSVRELASQLAINPNTIQRAYRELEAEGYIYTTAGRGSFAADVTDVNTKRRNELLKSFDEAAEELFFLGFHPEELKKRIDAIREGQGVK